MTTGLRRRGSYVVPLVVGVAMLLGACNRSDGETDSAAARGLLVLSGKVGRTTLTLRDADSPNGRRVPLPDPGTSWIAAGRGNVLVAALTDGSLQVSDPVSTNPKPAWRAVKAVGADGVSPAGPLYFPTWTVDGGAIASLEADFTSASDLKVVIIDPSVKSALELPVGAVPAAAAPAWVSEDALALVTGPAGSTGSTVVDTTSGDAAPGPTGIALVASSADASTVASWSGAGHPVEIATASDWVGGSGARTRVEPPRGGTSPGAMALDATAGRLAVAWLDEAGRGVSIAIYARSGGWRRVSTVAVEADAATVVAWLR